VVGSYPAALPHHIAVDVFFHAAHLHVDLDLDRLVRVHVHISLHVRVALSAHADSPV
jgi:hypothetical protein